MPCRGASQLALFAVFAFAYVADFSWSLANLVSSMSWSTFNSLDTAFFASNTLAASPGPASQPSSTSLLQHHFCLPHPLF